jgi:hypothetical protein
MQLSLRKIGCERQQAEHAVRRAVRVSQAVAQNHVAAALAVDQRAA